MIEEKQLPAQFRQVIETQLSVYNSKQSLQNISHIPDIKLLADNDPPTWYHLNGAICVYVDMVGSTRMGADLRKPTVARAYYWYVSTALHLFSRFSPQYINVHGDGVFAVFENNLKYTALAAAITFQTFSRELFIPRAQELVDGKVGTHIGIDQDDILLGEVGLRGTTAGSVRENEVWAGSLVNVSAKLAKMRGINRIHISDRYHRGLRDPIALESCECLGYRQLWTERDVRKRTDMDLESVYKSWVIWCREHGAERCERILQLDER